MTTTEHYRHLGVPTTLLGLSHSAWRNTGIQLILNHYAWSYKKSTHAKVSLMHELDLLIQEYDLNRRDRLEIFKAHKRGIPLPLPKPRVRRVPHPNLPDWKARGRRDIVAPTPIKAETTRLADCVVCFETLSPQNTPKRKITSSCNHKPDVCKSCLAASISTQINSKVWDQIDCPTCGQRLDFQDVEEFADSAVFGRLVPSL